MHFQKNLHKTSLINKVKQNLKIIDKYIYKMTQILQHVRYYLGFMQSEKKFGVLHKLHFNMSEHYCTAKNFT